MKHAEAALQGWWLLALESQHPVKADRYLEPVTLLQRQPITNILRKSDLSFGRQSRGAQDRILTESQNITDW